MPSSLSHLLLGTVRFLRRELPATLLALAATTAAPQPAWARDTILHIPVQQVLDAADFKSKSNGVKFSFGGAPVANGLGLIETSNKTNAFNKSDQEACRWVMESALLALQTKARAMGGSRVVNVVSVNKNIEFKSEKEFECHAGTLMAAVGLRGMVVK